MAGNRGRRLGGACLGGLPCAGYGLWPAGPAAAGGQRNQPRRKGNYAVHRHCPRQGDVRRPRVLGQLGGRLSAGPGAVGEPLSLYLAGLPGLSGGLALLSLAMVPGGSLPPGGVPGGQAFTVLVGFGSAPALSPSSKTKLRGIPSGSAGGNGLPGVCSSGFVILLLLRRQLAARRFAGIPGFRFRRGFPGRGSLEHPNAPLIGFGLRVIGWHIVPPDNCLRFRFPATLHRGTWLQSSLARIGNFPNETDCKNMNRPESLRHPLSR